MIKLFTALIFVFLPPIHGAYNLVVKQTTIYNTICVRGYTRTIRPPISFTTNLKIQQMKTYHLPGTTKDYEEDHLIPLELGGAPRSIQNLWPEPHSQSRVSDPLENLLHKRVCAGVQSLKSAQKEIYRFKKQFG